MRKYYLTAVLSLAVSMACAQKLSVKYKNYEVWPKGKYTSISSAAQLAKPGDTVTVHAGIYREQVDPSTSGTKDKCIVYRAAEGEHVEIRGSDIVSNWKRVGHQTYLLSLPNAYFGKFNPYADEIKGDWYDGKGWKQHTGAVYLDGVWLMECKSRVEVSVGHWYSEVDGDSTRIWANFGGADPNRGNVEINVRQSVFYPSRPGINYITVSGFVMKHAATNWAPPTAEQVGLIGTNWSKGWVIEDCDISYSKCAGITLGKYGDAFDNTSANSASGYVETVKRALQHGWNKETVGGHLVRNNTISFCEQAGIVGSLGCSYSTVTGNTIHDIHMQRLFSGAEQGAIKFHGAVDMTISKNIIFHNYRGIWLDWMAQGTRITGNLLYDHDDWDMYFEVDHGPILVDNNVMLSANSQRVWSQGVAYVHNLIGGKFEVWPFEARETPVLVPHSTAMLSLKNNPSGDVQLYNNIFSGTDCNLRLFDATQLPVKMAGNLYVNGALRAELDKTGETIREPVALELDKGVQQVRLAYPRSARLLVKPLSSVQLGKTVITKQGFEAPDGKPVWFDRDFFGRKRTGKVLAGPYAKYD